MTRETFVINVGKVTGGEGQTTGPLKLWKRDYYLLIADITFAGIGMKPAGTGLYKLSLRIGFTLWDEP